MAQSGPRPTWESRQRTSLLRRGWAAIATGLIVGLLAGALVTTIEKKQYTASASVFVTSTGVDDSTTLANARTNGTINLDTESQLVKSSDVAAQVRKIDPSASSSSLTDLIAHLKVTVPANTEILTISYVADSASTAAQRANEFATAYLTQRAADAQATLNAQIDKSQSNLTTLTARLEAVTSTLAALPKSSARVDFVKAQRSLLVNQIGQLTTQLTTLTTTVVTPGRIPTKATTPTAPSSPSRILNLSAGVAAGLLLGLLFAWLRFAIRRRLRRADDVESKLGLPVLGVIPASADVTLNPAGAAFQEYRRLTNVIAKTLGKPGTVLVTGRSSRAATIALVANIAKALATALVASDTTVRVMSTLSEDSDALCAAVAQPGEAPADSVQYLARPTLVKRETLEAMRGNGFLIVAAPDPEESADAQTIAIASDAVVVVIQARARADRAEAVLSQLDAVGAPVLGAVLMPTTLVQRRIQSTRRKTGRFGKHAVDPPEGSGTPVDTQSSDAEASPNGHLDAQHNDDAADSEWGAARPTGTPL